MPYTIACLKHGTLYDAHYVNTLKNMVRRNSSKDLHFICFTEDAKGIDPDIEILPLPELGLSGPTKAWWYKLKIFDPSLPYQGTVLFLDLDLVIIRSIDKLFDYHPGKFCIIDDYVPKPDSRVVRNSSVFRLEFGSYPEVWEQFIRFQEEITSRLAGDQNWITEKITDDEIWPKDWIISYRWNYANYDQNKSTNVDPNDFSALCQKNLPNDCSILVFHGPPKPHEVVKINHPDPLIVENWR